MKERLQIIKKIYPNYLIYIKKKDKLILKDIDLLISKLFDLKEVNYLVLDNLDIEKMQTFDNNKYDEYFIKTKLIQMIKEIEKRLK